MAKDLDPFISDLSNQYLRNFLPDCSCFQPCAKALHSASLEKGARNYSLFRPALLNARLYTAMIFQGHNLEDFNAADDSKIIRDDARQFRSPANDYGGSYTCSGAKSGRDSALLAPGRAVRFSARLLCGRCLLRAGRTDYGLAVQNHGSVLS